MNENLEKKLSILANILAGESIKICQDNGCTEDGHNCESYAYLDVERDTENEIVDFNLYTICAPDYALRMYDCAIPLPCVLETAKDMLRVLEDNCNDIN